MAEAPKMVHLTPAQKKRKKFSHLLTNDAPPPIPEERLNQLVITYFDTPKKNATHIEIGQILVVSYLRLLRSTVARYLYHWPITRRFLNEMVSSGTEAIVRVVYNLKPAQIKDGNILFSLTGLIESTIRTDIELIIAKLRGIAPASCRTNYRREKDQKKPIYGVVETDLTSDKVKDSRECYDIDVSIFEAKNAIEVIAQTKLEKQILAQETWGLSNTDLSKRLNVTSQHIGRVRNRLHVRYMKLGEKHE